MLGALPLSRSLVVDCVELNHGIMSGEKEDQEYVYFGS